MTMENNNNNSSSTIKYRILEDLTEHESMVLSRFKTLPVAQGIHDAYLMIFLFARKLDVERAGVILANNLEFRNSLQIPFPVHKQHIKDLSIVRSHYSFYVPGKLDKQGRSIAYLKPSALIPKDHEFEDIITHMLWNMDSTAYEHSSVHRKGLVVVEDLTNISILKHFDQRLKSHLKGKSLENVFTGRIQGIYLLHSPFYLRPLLALAKVFVKSKILQRVKNMNGQSNKMSDLIDPDQLMVEFGGTLEFNYDQWYDSLPLDY